MFLLSNILVPTTYSLVLLTSQCRALELPSVMLLSAPLLYTGPYSCWIITDISFWLQLVKASQQLKFCGDEITPHSTRNLEDQGIPFFAWFITFETSTIRGRTSIYTTAGIALRITLPCKTHHYAKAETPMGGPDMITPIRIHFFACCSDGRHIMIAEYNKIILRIYTSMYTYIYCYCDWEWWISFILLL